LSPADARRWPKRKLQIKTKIIGAVSKTVANHNQKVPLGKPPKWIVRKHQLEAWQTFSDEVPWLNHSHRALVGIASEIRGRLIAGEEVSVNGLNLLRLCLGQMGATPVDSSKITLPEDKDDADPSDKYFS
jgi:hypothetical protein